MTKQHSNIKNEKDIIWIKEASIIAADTLSMIEKYVKVGISTEELDQICNAFIQKKWWKSACIWYHWYPRYTCISLNDTICHWIPSKWEILKEWDILNIDITVYKNWYFWDTSRMYTVWKTSGDAQRLIDVTKKALEIWINEVYPWNMTWNIWYAISKYVEPLWYSVVREYTGHSIWKSMHEAPYIYHKAPKNSWVKMVPWMVFTIEPMINAWTYKNKVLGDKWTVKTLDWKLSAQFEHTILVTENSYEILTMPTVA